MRNPSETLQKDEDSEEVKLKKLYWKLVFAQEAFRQCRTMAEYYIEHVRNDNHPLYYPLTCATCVTYIRAFTHGEDVGQLPRRYSRFPNDELKATHRELLDSRHKMYAHKDASIRDNSVSIIAEVFPDHLEYSPAGHFMRLNGALFTDITTLCDFQDKRVKAELQVVMPKLLPLQEALSIASQTGSGEFELPIEW